MKLEVLNAKFGEVIVLLNTAFREAEIANVELGKIEGRRASTLKQIEELEKKVAELKDINSTANNKLRADMNEAERLVNLNKGKQSDLDRKQAEVEALLVETKKEKENLTRQVENYVSRNIEMSKREKEAEDKLKEAGETLKEAKLQQQSAKDSLRLADEISVDGKEKIEEAKRQMKKASDIMNEAAKVKAIGEQTIEENKKFEASLLKKKKELDETEADLVSQRRALVMLGDDLRNQELRIAKILKDRSIEANQVKGK